VTTNDGPGVPPERAPETTSVFRADFLTEAEAPAREQPVSGVDALPAGSALLVVKRGPNAGSRFLLFDGGFQMDSPAGVWPRRLSPSPTRHRRRRARPGLRWIAVPVPDRLVVDRRCSRGCRVRRPTAGLARRACPSRFGGSHHNMKDL